MVVSFPMHSKTGIIAGALYLLSPLVMSTLMDENKHGPIIIGSMLGQLIRPCFNIKPTLGVGGSRGWRVWYNQRKVWNGGNRCRCQGWQPSQQTRYVDPMLDQCWASVYDGGPALVQHWVDVSCLRVRTAAVALRLGNITIRLWDFLSSFVF